MKSTPRPDDHPDDLRCWALIEQSSASADQPALSPDEARALAADLKTHQIELEMQNEDLRLAQSELTASRDRFSDLYDFAPLGYATVGTNGMIVEANLTLAEMLHVERRKIIGQRFAAFIHDDDADIYYRHRKDTFAGKKRQTCRLRLRRSAEADIWAEVDSQSYGPPVLPETVVRHSVRDIADYRKIEAALHQTQRLESIGTLASGLAHNMNNVLQMVIGHAQLAHEAMEPDSPQGKNLDSVIQAAHRGAELVRQLLAFGRPSPAMASNLDMGQLVADTAELLRAMMPPPTSIILEVDPICGTVAGDAAELQQVILNLCTNAQQALPDGCGHITISLAEVSLPLADGSEPGELPEGRYVCVAVSDEGTGMTPEILHRAREPFFSTKSMFVGTGLGLFTAHGIVGAHRGTMQFTSQPGLGTKVLVYLPCARVTTAADEMRRSITWAQGTRPRIMFVDDEPLITGLVEQQLKRRGFAVETFQSGHAALDAFTADPGAFDLVITDQSMPAMKGTQLAAQITALRPGLPVVLISGLLAPQGEPGRALTGIVRSLAKPVSALDLERAIMEVMGSVTDPDPAE